MTSAGGRRKKPTRRSAVHTHRGLQYTDVYEIGAMDMSADPAVSRM